MEPPAVVPADATSSGKPPNGTASATESAGSLKLDEAQIAKIHSTVRWGKSEAEIEEVIKVVGTSTADALSAEDPKNGNRCLHIAAQNGHQSLVTWLLGEKADVNAQNLKGQTALHMSVEYDFYFQTLVLLEAGADKELTNADGHAAIQGLEGGKVGGESWDNPVTVLKAAGDNLEELEVAMSMLEQADPSSIDKAMLVQAGMAKRKRCKDNWNAERFAGIMKDFERRGARLLEKSVARLGRLFREGASSARERSILALQEAVAGAPPPQSDSGGAEHLALTGAHPLLEASRGSAPASPGARARGRPQGTDTACVDLSGPCPAPLWERNCHTFSRQRRE
eukprot:CAMPEP_0176212700 /NCGR_PEP_ID=MMETSP0121_2-20121125/15285_1 /TAXON_ID=160619 /ORGANISM="Kryptoperidinium foliaceum, Strain CCMP 1326" /LENGTH=338 /DNA_ID=CAMNT_0017551753 /DNA_START=72 /DNA_END=1087 /DNA_ORIENTATION=+